MSEEGGARPQGLAHKLTCWLVSLLSNLLLGKKGLEQQPGAGSGKVGKEHEGREKGRGRWGVRPEEVMRVLGFGKSA